MIICPFCKEEIEERSYYCDQCGQALSYCTSCGHVGSGRRCTYCGGIMQSAKEIEAAGQRTTMAESLTSASPVTSISRSSVDISQSLVDPNVPQHQHTRYQWGYHRATSGTLSPTFRKGHVCVRCSCPTIL